MGPRARWLTARECSPYRAWLKVDLLILVPLLELLTRLLPLLIPLPRYKMLPSTAIALAACYTSSAATRFTSCRCADFCHSRRSARDL